MLTFAFANIISSILCMHFAHMKFRKKLLNEFVRIHYIIPVPAVQYFLTGLRPLAILLIEKREGC